MKKLIFLVAIVLMVETNLEAKIIVHGHRGCRAVRPENTLASMTEALRVGVHVLEMDIGITKDRVPVLSHDKFINKDICQYEDGRRVTSKIPIFSLTLKEVRTFDCGTLKNPKFPKQVPAPKEKIPTLEEVLQMVVKSKDAAAQTVEFNIETKIEADTPELAPSPEEFVTLIMNVIKKYKLENRVILQSFDFRTLRAARKTHPEVRVSTLVEGYFANVVKIARSEKPTVMSPDFSLLSAKKVEELHSLGVQVVPWTLNTESEWREAIAWGVDGIITDDPESLINYLKKNNAF